MKDIMLLDNPAFVMEGAPGAPNGCKGDLHDEFVKTIKKLKNLNVDYVYMTQWHWAATNPDGTWFITKAEDTFGSLSDADLTFFVQTAHANGIKVIMMNQIQGMLNSNDSSAYLPPATTENIQKWLVAFKSFMIERSAFFESIGLDAVELGCRACIFVDWGDESDAQIALFKPAYKDIAREVRKIYMGKTMMQLATTWLLSDPDFLSFIDIFKMTILGTALTESQMNNLTVESYKVLDSNSNAFGWIQRQITQLEGLGKQTMIEFGGVQSRQNVFTFPGYIEETSCTAALNVLNPSQDQCIQKNQIVDFSVQAIFFESILELVNQINSSTGFMVFAADYWETDTLTPQTAFPNIAVSVRNKPAEGILKSWYAR